jgi:hypothetical protein
MLAQPWVQRISRTVDAMFPTSLLAAPLGRAALVVLLVLLCLAIPVTRATANADAESPVVHAPTGGVVLGFFDDVMGNRTRMIQVGAVFVVVGILLLRMSYR